MAERQAMAGLAEGVRADVTKASAGGAGGARGVGLQDYVFAWAGSFLAAEAALPDLGLQGIVVQVGAQTGFDVDDVAVLTDQQAYALFQAKAGLNLGKGADSPLAKAVQQIVAQYLTGRLPVRGAPDRPIEVDRDVLVLCTDATAPKTVRVHLRNAVERTGRQPAGTRFGHNLNVNEQTALAVLVSHLRRCWAAAGRPDPTDEELRRLVSMMRVVTVDARPGEPQHAVSLATLGTVVATGTEDRAWNALLAKEAHPDSEKRLWLNRPQLAVVFQNSGAPLDPSVRYSHDIEVLRTHSASNLQLLGGAAQLPIAAGLHLPRVAATELTKAIQDQGLLLLGAPGAGKTGLAVRLVEQLQTQQDVLLLTTADVAGTNRLVLQHALVDTLGAWTGEPAVLVIDGLDALRGSEDRSYLVNIVTGLAGSRWRALATVRTFDARHHAALRDAFAGSPLDTEAPPADRVLQQVRHLLVDDLTEAELAPALIASPKLAMFLAHADPQLRRLLRNPFNLRLAARLVDEGAAAQARLSAARSQLDVLDAYWDRRVRNEKSAERNTLLTRLCRHMLSTRALRVRENEPVVQSSDATAVDGLLIENVLGAECSSGLGGPRILSFSHNILFDYAVAQYVLLDPLDPVRTLLGEFDADPSLPLIARPSLDMVLDHLWEYQRPTFWQFCLAVAASPHLLVTLSVAARLLTLVADPADLSVLGQLLTEDHADEPSVAAGQAVVSHLVGAMRAATMPQAQAEHVAESVAQLALTLAKHASTSGEFMHGAMAVDLLTALHLQLPLGPATPAAADRAQAVAALLDACRMNAAAMEQIAGYAVSQLAGALAADPTTSGAVVRLIQDEMALAQWGGTVLTHLPDVATALLPGDRVLACRVALVVWGFDEQRDEQVRLGGGALMPLRESRRQQAQHGAYRLGEHFGKLCAVDLLGAALIFCDIASTGLMPSNTATTAPRDWPLTINGTMGWLQYGHHLETMGVHGVATKMAQAVATELARQVRAGIDPGPVITALVERLHHAPAWAAVLGGTDDREGLGRAFLPVLASGALLAHDDTHESAARLLEALAHADEPPPSADLESAVAAAAQLGGPQSRPRLLDELLGCLLPESLTQPGLVARRAELDAAGGPPPLTPRLQMSSSVRPYSLVQDLLDDGAQITQPIDMWRRLETEIRHRRENHDGSPGELPDAFMAVDAALAESAPPDARLRALLVDAASQLALDPRVLPDTYVGERAVALLLETAQGDETGRFLAGDQDAYTSGLVDTAAAGLAYLIQRRAWVDSNHGAALDDAARMLLTHREPVVRVRVVQGFRALHRGLAPADLVQALASYLQDESHSAVQAFLLAELGKVAGAAPDATDEALHRLAGHPAGAGLSRHHIARISEPLRPLAAFLAVEVPNGFVSELVTGWFSEPLRHVENVTAMLHWLRPFFNPVDSRGQRTALALLRTAATVAAARWATAEPAPTAAEAAELEAAARVADGIAEQLYFASGAFETRRATGEDDVPRRDVRTFADLAVPVLQLCATVPDPQCTHHVVETLVHLAPLAEYKTLLILAEVVPASGPYSHDSLASGVVVPYLQRLIIEHPDMVVGDASALSAFRYLLQTFAAAGHADALALCYGFADVFR